MHSVMFAIFITLQLVLVAFDLWGQSPRRRDVAHPEPLRWRTLFFLSAITVVFLTVQLCGGWLMPQPLKILQSVHRFASTWTGHAVEDALSGGTAAFLGVLLFYVAGFWDYVVHRFFSHNRWFWLTHEYHHLPNYVCVLMPGILVRPFGFLPVSLSTLATGATVYTLLSLFQLPLWDLTPLLPTLLVIGLVLTSSHSAFLRKRPIVHKVLRWLFVTSPQEHLLHHAVDSCGNFGNFTTLWDRIFGTYIDPTDANLEEVPLGLSYDQDFLGTLTMGALHLTPAQRQRYQVGRFCNLKDTGNA